VNLAATALLLQHSITLVLAIYGIIKAANFHCGADDCLSISGSMAKPGDHKLFTRGRVFIIFCFGSCQAEWAFDQRPFGWESGKQFMVAILSFNAGVEMDRSPLS